MREGERPANEPLGAGRVADDEPIPRDDITIE
jgi:hypothetical protein